MRSLGSSPHVHLSVSSCSCFSSPTLRLPWSLQNTTSNTLLGRTGLLKSRAHISPTWGKLSLSTAVTLGLTQRYTDPNPIGSFPLNLIHNRNCPRRKRALHNANTCGSGWCPFRLGLEQVQAPCVKQASLYQKSLRSYQSARHPQHRLRTRTVNVCSELLYSVLGQLYSVMMHDFRPTSTLCRAHGDILFSIVLMISKSGF